MKTCVLISVLLNDREMFVHHGLSLFLPSVLMTQWEKQGGIKTVAINAQVAEELVLTESLVCLFSEAMFGVRAVQGDDYDIVHLHLAAAVCMWSVLPTYY